MDKLTMKFKKTDNPFLQEQNGSQYDLWGELTLQYGDRILLKREWEMHNWISKFIKNEVILLEQDFPFQYRNSIEESCDLLRAEIVGDDDDIELSEEAESKLEITFDYMENHDFHLMGTDTQHFTIGLNPSGNGEISSYVEDEDKYHKYEFDMPTFVEQAGKSIINYLKKFQLKLTSDEEYFEKFLGEEYAQYIGENARLNAMGFGF